MLHQGRQRRSYKNRTEVISVGRRVLRLRCVGNSGSDPLVHRVARGEVVTDARNFPQIKKTGKRHHNSGRPREGHLGHEARHKKHERRA